jgi:hypothetical protein
MMFLSDNFLSISVTDAAEVESCAAMALVLTKPSGAMESFSMAFK